MCDKLTHRRIDAFVIDDITLHGKGFSTEYIFLLDISYDADLIRQAALDY